MTAINLPHAHYEDVHLAHVAAEMAVLGGPSIRAIEVAGEIFAVEGCHRLRAAEASGMPVTLVPLDIDGTIDLDTLDYDDMGWFEDRAAAPVSELFERMFPAGQPEAAVYVEIA